jgi:hypothetical protein
MSAIDEIIEERRLQDGEWGGPAHDDDHTYEDWAEILGAHATRLDGYLRDGGNTVVIRRRAIVVAALAAALIESIDRDGEGVQEMTAQVVKVAAIIPHPDPETIRLEILSLSNGIEIVTGKHYEVGQLGIYIPAKAMIPGWLAEELWLVAKGDAWFEVQSKVMRGVPSPGVFIGQRYRKDKDRPSFDWETFPQWRDRWVEGDDVAAYLGVRFMP